MQRKYRKSLNLNIRCKIDSFISHVVLNTGMPSFFFADGMPFVVREASPGDGVEQVIQKQCHEVCQVLYLRLRALQVWKDIRIC
jgi:hypothetical protein